MAALQGGPINTTEHERTQIDGTPLPVGLYKGIVTKTEQKETAGASGPGVQVIVEFDITWPEEFHNRKFWDRFNIINSNQDTVRIAKEGLSDLAEAAYQKGFVLSDDEELIGREVTMELYIEPAKPYIDKRTNEQRPGKAQNKCKKYWNPAVDVEAAKKERKAASSTTGVPAQPQGAVGNVAQKWGGQKPAASAPAPRPAPVVQQPVQQAAVQQQAAAPAGNVAPWKRNKQ